MLAESKVRKEACARVPEVSICQQMSAYVSILQHTSAYVSPKCDRRLVVCLRSAGLVSATRARGLVSARGLLRQEAGARVPEVRGFS